MVNQLIYYILCGENHALGKKRCNRSVIQVFVETIMRTMYLHLSK